MRNPKMLNRMFQGLRQDRRGITGLETAIILIAFVVVASVFAYTVLSAGIFSSEKGKQAVHAGLESARASFELVGSVKATALPATGIDDVDTPSSWATGSSDISLATDTSDIKEGTAALDVTVDAAFTSGLIAYIDISALNLSSHFSVTLWIKADSSVAANVLQLVLDENAGCASPEETLNIPALTANTWLNPLLKLTKSAATPADIDAIQCVGIQAASDPGAITFSIDDIKAPAEVTEIHFVIANALDGESINLTTTTDADNDGLISDESTKSHELSVVYTDQDQRTVDVTWTKVQIGKGDGDNLLEPGEKFSITVKTHGSDPMPIANTKFAISLLRDSGPELNFERTLPKVLDNNMDLN